MKSLTIVICLGLGLVGLVQAGPTAWAADPATETIVLLRHGEKPPAGLGQIDCQGLNRALALPPVLVQRFGRPAAIFAPNPATRVRDPGGVFDYVRPLATIEPTAIALGLPVDASIGFTDLARLEERLGQPHLHGALVFVAWEHLRIVTIVRSLLARHGGDAGVVPEWRDDDYDSIYVVRIARSGDRTRASFEHTRQGLDGQPRSCPG
jgi:hypothetical protein